MYFFFYYTVCHICGGNARSFCMLLLTFLFLRRQGVHLHNTTVAYVMWTFCTCEMVHVCLAVLAQVGIAHVALSVARRCGDKHMIITKRCCRASRCCWGDNYCHTTRWCLGNKSCHATRCAYTVDESRLYAL